jgi:hypothetical protein
MRQAAFLHFQTLRFCIFKLCFSAFSNFAFLHFQTLLFCIFNSSATWLEINLQKLTFVAMASGSGSAQLTQTSRDWAIAFAVSEERDEAFRIKVETSQMEMERAMMAKEELETRLALEVQRVEELLNRRDEHWSDIIREELAWVRHDLARVSRELNRRDVELRREVHRRTVEARRLQRVELAQARIL